MKKVVKKWGNTGLGIYISLEEQKVYNVKAGDIVELELKKVGEVKKENGTKIFGSSDFLTR